MTKLGPAQPKPRSNHLAVGPPRESEAEAVPCPGERIPPYGAWKPAAYASALARTDAPRERHSESHQLRGPTRRLCRAEGPCPQGASVGAHRLRCRSGHQNETPASVGGRDGRRCHPGTETER